MADYDPDQIPPLHDLPAELEADTPADSAPQPSGYLWLFYLFLRPRTFFRHFVLDPSPVLTALCAWVYGMSTAIDRIDFRAAAGNSLPTETWPQYWGIVAVVGVIGGLFYFAVGGWWYRVRLRWCGAVEPDPALARRVYLYASQVLVLPTLLTAVCETVSFGTPAEARAAESAWYLLPLIFPFWSLWTSYAGVRTAFDVRRAAALCWFVILPGVFYVVVVGVIGIFLALTSFGGVADVDHPLVHQSRTMHFSYPGNWWIDDTNESHDPDADVYVEPWQDAAAHIMIYESENDPRAEVEISCDSYRTIWSDPQDSSTFDRWGDYRGRGAYMRFNADGTPCVVRIFATALSPDRILEIQEVYLVADEADVRPGFDLIRSTFRIRE